MKKILILASVLALSCGSAFASSYMFGDGTPENTYVTGSQIINRSHDRTSPPCSHKQKGTVKKQQNHPSAWFDDTTAPCITRFGDGTPKQ